MPLMTGQPVELGGRRFVDAGVSESLPVRTAIAQQATHILALRTRRSDEQPTATSRLERAVASRWFARHAPGAIAPWLDRVALREEEERLLESHPGILQIRPPLGSPRIGRTERGEALLRAAVDTGRRAAWDVLAPCVATADVAD